MTDTLRRHFLENPVWVCAALAIAELILIMLWRRLIIKRWPVLVICPLLIVVVLGVSIFVQTEREKLEELTEQVVALAEQNDVPAISNFVDEDYNYGGMNKSRWFDLSMAFSEIYRFESLSIKDLQITVSSDTDTEAEALLRVLVNMDPEAQGVFLHRMFYYTGKLYWTKDDKGQWKITAMVPLKYNDQDLSEKSLLGWLVLLITGE